MPVIAVTLKARAGQEAAMQDVLLRLARHSRTEDGCVAYLPHVDASDPGTFFLYEHWADEETLQRHRETDEFKQWAGVELKAALDHATRADLTPIEPDAEEP